MRIAESRLRKLIRSVIRESFEEEVEEYSEKKYPDHFKLVSLLDDFFDIHLYKKYSSVEIGWVTYTKKLIAADNYNAGLSDLVKEFDDVDKFASRFVKAVKDFMTQDSVLRGTFNDHCERWDAFKDEKSEDEFFNFINSFIEEISINRHPDDIADE